MAWNPMELHEIENSPEIGRWSFKQMQIEPDFSLLAAAARVDLKTAVSN